MDQAIPAEVLVLVNGPARLSPGQVADYAVEYTSMMTTTVQSSVLMVRLPALATYMESSVGGNPRRNATRYSGSWAVWPPAQRTSS